MKHWILTALTAFTLTLASFADRAQRPNVLLITADDMGWYSLGYTGNTMSGISPNLDTFASEGVLIEHCFISTPICGPSRALNTTRYTHVWNGWPNGETQQSRAMGEEVKGLLKQYAATAEDQSYTELVGVCF